MLRKLGRQGIRVLTGLWSAGGMDQGTSYHLTGWWTPAESEGDRKTSLSLGGGGGKSRSHAEGHSAEASSFTDMAGWLWNMLETGPPSGLSIAVSGGAQ